MNIFLILGRMTVKPEMKESQSGYRYTEFGLAVKEKYSGRKNVDTTNKHRKFFINVTAFSQKAQYLCDYARKGDWVVALGHIKVSKYKNRTGQVTTRTSFIADEIEIIFNDAREAKYKPDDTLATVLNINPNMDLYGDYMDSDEEESEGDIDTEDVPF